jgi:hypothetical protein
VNTATETNQLTFPWKGLTQDDWDCAKCLLFEDLSVALRISIGTLRNWKYLGTITPIHSVARRPHFRLDQVRSELRRNGKIREGGCW